MKTFILIISVMLGSNSFGAERKSILRQNYVVVSDEYNPQVPSGKCLVTGMVCAPETDGDGKQLPRVGVKVATLDQKKSTLTDSTGKFKLLLDESDTSIFMFAEGLEEIVVWKYEFKSKHVVTINFYPYYDNMMLEVDKPVIYLYSPEPVDAEVRFSCKGDLTFTYPEYNAGWNVRVNGKKLTDLSTQKSYPYLFWEAQTTDLRFKRSEDGNILGCVIQTDSAVSFLENSLQALGLNETEATDFITFWGPQLIKEPYALVQFWVDDELNSGISDLQITPRPDALRRVYMLFKPYEFDPGIETTGQSFDAFERKGFTALEWGGTQAGSYALNPEMVN